jgi:hypothetical protein
LCALDDKVEDRGMIEIVEGETRRFEEDGTETRVAVEFIYEILMGSTWSGV